VARELQYAMKLIRILAGALCIAGLASGLRAAPANPNSAYQEAVKSYITAASNEVQAIRQQADAATKEATPEVKERYAEFYSQLADCEKALAELKTAEPGNFDRVKARYEQERAALVKAQAKANLH
jgi:hypothetical protein